VVRLAARIPPELRPDDVDQLSTGALPNLKDTVVVLIEDNISEREALYELLVDWGCYVIDAESAEDTINKLRNEQLFSSPNFILSDYRLREEKSGLEAIAAIRNEIKSPVPAAIWSAETSPEILQRIAAAGVDMLSKPVDEMQLLRLLKRQTPQIAAKSSMPAELS
jgi:CheY-like chemotaxis protein